jgi:hypothetical protein
MSRFVDEHGWKMDEHTPKYGNFYRGIFFGLFNQKSNTWMCLTVGENPCKSPFVHRDNDD